MRTCYVEVMSLHVTSNLQTTSTYRMAMCMAQCRRTNALWRLLAWTLGYAAVCNHRVKVSSSELLRLAYRCQTSIVMKSAANTNRCRCTCDVLSDIQAIKILASVVHQTQTAVKLLHIGDEYIW